jgi:alpha-L-rhamnosidase
MIEPIRVTQTLKPVAVTEPRPGVFVFDLGQNLVGWCRLKVSGPAGAQVSLRHAETLNADCTLYLANIRGARVGRPARLVGDGVGDRPAPARQPTRRTPANLAPPSLRDAGADGLRGHVDG